jgi:succinate-acetate transporter protein
MYTILLPALSAYGAFWMSYAVVFIPDSGIIAAFGGQTEEFHQAFGIYLMVWFMITVMYM